MEVNAADSSTIAYNKLPLYLQPYSVNSIPSYSVANSAPVGYTSATVQLRSTHHRPAADEPHLSDCGITPSPSGSSSSSRDGGETQFRPAAEFDGISTGTCCSIVPLTPSESSRSGSVASDGGSSREGDLPSVLLVQIPRQPRVTVTKEPEENGEGTNGTTNSPGAPPTTSPAPVHAITINLLDKELWQTFKSMGNEMIVTKPGR